MERQGPQAMFHRVTTTMRNRENIWRWRVRQKNGKLLMKMKGKFFGSEWKYVNCTFVYDTERERGKGSIFKFQTINGEHPCFGAEEARAKP